MRRHELSYALNAGGVDPEAIARVDLEKMRIAGEHPVANLLPRVLGPLTIRPGTEMLTQTAGNASTRMVTFSRAIGTSYMLLLSEYEMRVMLNGAVQQVPAVSTAIASGSWSDVSTSPATATGGASLTFAATSSASAKLRQTVTVALADRTLDNVLRVVVGRGPVVLRIGTTAGGEDLLADATLDTGTHKISVVPNAATIYVELRSDDPVERTVSSINFEAVYLGGAGDLVIPTPWSMTNVVALRTQQSIDVLYCGDGYNQQRQIEHRGPLSWGIALYRSNNGPFIPGPSRLTMTPAALTGNTTLTASEGYFKSGHVGALIELTQTGKTVSSSFNANGQTSDYVTIIGISAGRTFQRTGVSSSFVGTIVLERSFDPDDPTSWTTYSTYVDAAAGFAKIDVADGQDNLTVHYRYRVTAYTSGSATMTLEYVSGVQIGRARVTGYTSATQVSIETIVNFGNTGATRNWRIGDWSSVRGWPRTPVIHDGRLIWFRQDQVYGSVSDDYTNFDDETIGDSGPFQRSVGSGGEEGVVWALALDKLTVGTAAFEAVIAASELDQALTPTAFTVRKPSRRGCADLNAVEYDDGAFFTQRSKRRLYDLHVPQGSNRFRSHEISRLNPAAFRNAIRKMAVQQQPDTRLYVVLWDGTMAVVTYDREDEVVAITTILIEGSTIEDVAAIQDVDQDDIYVIVLRGGNRYIERFAKEAAQRSVSTCALLDHYDVLTGSVSQITGATHLAGETVNVWADGERRANVTLNGSGVGTLDGTYSRVVYGKSYTGEFRTVKLAYAAQLGTALGQTKRIAGAGLILANSCLDGIRIGRGSGTMDPMPDIVNGEARTPSQFFTHYDHDVMPINSDWGTDSRVYFTVVSAEGPFTAQAIVFDIETRDGAPSGG